LNSYRAKAKPKKNKSEISGRRQIRKKKENIQKEELDCKKSTSAVSKTVRINILLKWL
jgi:hypothetical protein